ncbi:response regulator transcription factor [Actinoalloteichus hymeniacidonis]|uniref:response regulator transcription factor n=1 Tax=Actinoalloteichus hymeniacidonis TaxID=340345 RepID=UPI0012FA1EF5|nr:response regulator transcription factor [Actinoalloteichus hymeniacidonis]MBB5910271.1 DNA-binding response OmpR family regulator [Actinoalloteichus hymeniacidonis]
MQPRVLVADDEPGVRRALERGLTAEGMIVVTAGTGPQALRLASTGSFDAVLLDIMLPGLSGYRVLQQIRADGNETPVLLVSAKDGEVDQADGLDLGADGYVVKPFSFLVLLAQLRAVLRRAGDREDRTVLTVSHLAVDLGARRVTWHGNEVSLSPREYAVLAALLRRAGSVVTKEELLREVWGDEEAASRNVVEVYVGYLRRKLQAAGAHQVVRTVRGHGYLAAEPEPDAVSETSSTPEPGPTSQRAQRPRAKSIAPRRLFRPKP